MLVISYSIYPDSIKEFVVQPGDKEYGKYIKHIYYYNDKNEILKIDSYFDKEYSEKIGFYRQITSFRDNVEYSFEMFETDSMKAKSGLERRIDYVDRDDRIIKVELFFVDGNVFTLNETAAKVLDKFQIRKLSYFEEILVDTLPEDGAISIEAPIFRGISLLENTSDVSLLTEGEKKTIAAWIGSHKFQDFSSLYQRKLLFHEGQNSYWIAFQESLIPSLNSDGEMLVHYYYIGGYGKIPIFLAIGFIDK